MHQRKEVTRTHCPLLNKMKRGLETSIETCAVARSSPQHIQEKKPSTRTLVVTDIFGKTEALESLIYQLPGDVQVVDPYGGKDMHFKDEIGAYNYFMERVGIGNYTHILAREIKTQDTELQLLGFSVGAAACWCVTAAPESSFVRQAICFYGSQIRYHIAINPTLNTILVLPREEPTFDVHALAHSLVDRQFVSLVQSTYLHGFMNAISPNFDAQGYKTYINWLVQTLR